MLFLCVHILGPLVTDSVTDLDKAVIKLWQKYKTYIVEYDVEEVVCLDLWQLMQVFCFI